MPGPLPDPLLERLLARWPVARLATVAADGRPHVVPVVFAWCEGALWSPIDAKPKRGGPLARERHLAREPRAALLLDRYDADWDALWWIRIDGRAELRPVPADAGAGSPEARATAALRAKYPQYRRVALFATPEAARLVRLVPERTASWYASDRVLAALREA